MSDQASNLFSHRNGLSPLPPQLRLGELSKDMRRLFFYYIDLEIKRNTEGMYSSYFGSKWARVAMDFHVIFCKLDPDTYEDKPHELSRAIKKMINQNAFNLVFDLIEFLLIHPLCSGELKSDLAGVFVSTRAAYRVFDNRVVAIGTDEQAAAVQHAIEQSELQNSSPARKHLIDAGLDLRRSDWAGSIRNSIHAVESLAIRFAPGTTTLGPALSVIEKNGHLHGALKNAFNTLYGYSSDEKGVRHALVFDDQARVDETDALFMLGACASFVSYLLSRATPE